MSNLPKVTFGFVNCNRLFYLKSCVESFIETTKDYDNKELIIVDNASIEEGTDKYLSEKEKQGVIVVRTTERDPANEYARALNTIVEKSSGDFIAPLAADMQFVVEGNWLHSYVECMTEHSDKIGHINFDAQRTIRNKNTNWGDVYDFGGFRFIINKKKGPVMGAANCLFSKEIIESIYPWPVDNDSHEGGSNSETRMLNKVVGMNLNHLGSGQPFIPVSVAIYNEQGTNARVRDNKRIGIYFGPKESYKYYEVYNCNELIDRYKNRNIPIGIEDISKSIGWKLPISENGEWIKLGVVESDKQPVTYVNTDDNPNIIEGSTWFNV